MESKLMSENNFKKEDNDSLETEENKESKETDESDESEENEESDESVESDESDESDENEESGVENENERDNQIDETDENKKIKEEFTLKNSDVIDSVKSDEGNLLNNNIVDKKELSENEYWESEKIVKDPAPLSLSRIAVQFAEMIKSNNYEEMLNRSLEIPRSKRKEINLSMLSANEDLEKLLKNQKNNIIVFIIHGLFSTEAQYDAFMIHYCLETLKNVNYVMKIFALKTKSKMEDIANIYSSRYKTSLMSALKTFIPDKDFIKQLFTIDRYQLDEKEDVIEKNVTEIYKNIYKIPAKNILNIFISYSPLSFQKFCSIFYMKYGYPITYYVKSRSFEMELNEVIIIFHDVLLSPFANQLRIFSKFSIVKDSLIFFTYSLLSLNEEVIEILNTMYNEQYSLEFNDLTQIYPEPLNNFMRNYINRCIN